MSPKRIKQRFNDFDHALERLKEVLNEDPKKTSIVVDATIKRFEFTFELSWKLLQVVLAFEAIDVQTPRAIIKEAFQKGLIQNGDEWIQMLEDRNKTSHIYDEIQANAIYQKIKNKYCSLLDALRVHIKAMIQNIDGELK